MKKSKIIAILIEINYAPKNGSGKFVGAVYDSTSQDGDLPVAIVVGINYGQCETAGNVANCEAEVNYAKHITILGKKNYHTVIWNFYPYLTKYAWMDDVLNSAEQELRVFDAGYVDPFAVFSNLVLKLQPELIVFHGITSAVPVLARSAIRCVGRTAILVPNLSRGLNPSRATKIS